MRIGAPLEAEQVRIDLLVAGPVLRREHVRAGDLGDAVQQAPGWAQGLQIRDAAVTFQYLQSRAVPGKFV